MRCVNGILKIVKDGHYVESIVMKNEAPIKIAIGVKIKSFNLQSSFGPAAVDGPIVPKSVDARVEGRAFLAVSFDESETVRYSDYERVGGLSSPPT